MVICTKVQRIGAGFKKNRPTGEIIDESAKPKKGYLYTPKTPALTALNCMIIDDEEIARLKAISVIRKHPQLHILGNFDAYESARPALEKNKVDVLFLDVDMPGMNGLEIRKTLQNIPACIFITSHPEYAAESFEVDTLDFIVKPLTEERFSRTARRITDFFEAREKISLFDASFSDDYIVIKEGYEKVKVKLYHILYIEALKDYCMLVTENKRYYILSAMGNLLKQGHFSAFTRIHRSYAVQKQFIEKISSGHVVLTNNIRLPIGDAFRQNIAAEE